MRTSDRFLRLQFLVFAVITLTPITCDAAVINDQRHWLESDLIVKGTLIDTETVNGETLGFIAVEQVLKESTQPLGDSFYLKGYGEKSTIKASNVVAPLGQSYIFFMEQETEAKFRVVNVKPIENTSTPTVIDTGSVGLAVMIALTLTSLIGGKERKEELGLVDTP